MKSHSNEKIISIKSSKYQQILYSRYFVLSTVTSVVNYCSVFISYIEFDLEFILQFSFLQVLSYSETFQYKFLNWDYKPLSWDYNWRYGKLKILKSLPSQTRVWARACFPGKWRNKWEWGGQWCKCNGPLFCNGSRVLLMLMQRSVQFTLLPPSFLPLGFSLNSPSHPFKHSHSLLLLHLSKLSNSLPSSSMADVVCKVGGLK